MTRIQIHGVTNEARCDAAWPSARRAALGGVRSSVRCGAALGAMPDHAIVLLRGDHVTNTARYLQTCAGLRPDLDLLSDLETEVPRRTTCAKLSTCTAVVPGYRYLKVPVPKSTKF